MAPRQEHETAPRHSTEPLWQWRPRLAVAAGLCALALVVLTAAVSGPTAPAWELDVVDAATDFPDAIGYPARGVMELGTLRLAAASALVSGAVLRRWRPAVALAGAALAAWLVSNELKDIAERSRPMGVQLRDGSDGFGYTSTHAAVAFALATVAAPLVPARWRWVPSAAAVVVGWARMHVGVHFPVDVLGGALVGVAIGLGVRSVFRYTSA